jgi:hypothetical protein
VKSWSETADRIAFKLALAVSGLESARRERDRHSVRYQQARVRVLVRRFDIAMDHLRRDVERYRRQRQQARPASFEAFVTACAEDCVNGGDQ